MADAGESEQKRPISPTASSSEADKVKEKAKVLIKMGDRTTSDVVVRLRTHEGRDHWFYCHSEILIAKSKYFAERLSEDWPTCQILDSRYCVEVYCQEVEFNFHVSALRLLYVTEPCTWHGVRNTIGILQVAVHLGCHQMACDCVEYLEAVPWEEADEEEMLRTIPHLGSHYEHILARLQPVDPTAVIGIFISALHFATSSPPPSMQELKSSAQDQLEYMLTEDDDAPLLAFDNNVIKSEVKNCATDLLTRFSNFLESLSRKSTVTVLDMNMKHDFHSFLSDISWVCQILNKMEMMKDLVHYWVGSSPNIVRATEQAILGDNHETRLKVVEVTAKVLEAIGSGNVILPSAMRLCAVNIWIPFVQETRHLAEQVDLDAEETSNVVLDSEIWQGLESAIVSTVLTLPSGCQAEILAEWLRSKHVRYPDLKEAFEVWCYRSKVAKRRLALLGGMNTV
ncbi:BTB/POZ domain-containing protein At3g05675 [Typha angustifolia]|uniref:BTB/POZ domain-containing protein At3g05675 n=1 Tax=Typha angustifolia TaxID=59011 RepID=UPI003C2D4BE4